MLRALVVPTLDDECGAEVAVARVAVGAAIPKRLLQSLFDPDFLVEAAVQVTATRLS